MNVLQLTMSFADGGRREAIATLGRHLRRLGAQVDLCCLDELGCTREDVGDVADRVETLKRRFVFDRKALGRLVRFCRERRIGVVHAHEAAAQFAGGLLRLFAPRIRLLMTFHRSLGFESVRRRDRLRNAFACAQSGAIVTGSRERRAHFLQENFVRGSKVVRIPFGIETRRFHPNSDDRNQIRRDFRIPENATVLGAVGHFGEEKGIDVVLRGFELLLQREWSTPVVLVVLGDGTADQRASIQKLSSRMPDGHVVLPGFRKDVERWFRAFDLFVHAPRLEAFGLVLAEAMASELPIVATRVGGIPDIVRDGQTGLLVPSDSPAELASAAERLLRDEELRRSMGTEGRRVALAEYTAEVYARRYLRLYEDLLARRAPRGVDEAPEIPIEPYAPPDCHALGSARGPHVVAAPLESLP